MDQSIVTKRAIVADAELAARFVAAGGVAPVNPHPADTEAHRVWAAAFARWTTEHAGGEASA